MTTSDDPFEAAARHEDEAWLRRRVLGPGGRRARESKGVLVAFVVFGGPYGLWAAVRSTSHRWGPGVGHALTNFFFGSGFWFAAYTLWLLFLLWVWGISALSESRSSGDRAQ